MFGLSEPKQPDALDLLQQDHAEVDDMFKEYEESKLNAEGATKAAHVAMICTALTIHARIEEEIFYPAVRGGSRELDDLLNEAAVEHQSLKDIIGRLEAAPPSDPLYDAGVKVLSEYVKHHVDEEEGELFPKVRKLELDLRELGQRLMTRKEELEGVPQPTDARNGTQPHPDQREARQTS